jgi:hypothetical protein
MPDFQSIGGMLALLGGIAAVMRRKHAIGGWLFYFFCQVLLGLALIGATTQWKFYLPQSWIAPAPYFLYALSSLSRTLLLAAIAAVSIEVVRTREWGWICGLQYALLTYAFLTILKVLVDIYGFPAAATRDALSLSFPCVWIVYFGASRRVRRVFLDKTW